MDSPKRTYYNDASQPSISVVGEPIGIAYLSGDRLNVLTDNGWRTASVKPQTDEDGSLTYPRPKAPVI